MSYFVAALRCATPSRSETARLAVMFELIRRYDINATLLAAGRELTRPDREATDTLLEMLDRMNYAAFLRRVRTGENVPQDAVRNHDRTAVRRTVKRYV